MSARCCNCDLPLSLDPDSRANSHWNAWICLRLAKAEIGRLSQPQPLKFPRGPTGDIDAEYLENVISHLREHGGGPVAMIRWTLLALESLTAEPEVDLATAQRHGEGQS